MIEPDALPCGVVPEDEPEIVEQEPKGIEMEDIGGTDPMEVDDALQGVIDVNDDDDFSLPMPSAGGDPLPDFIPVGDPPKLLEQKPKAHEKKARPVEPKYRDIRDFDPSVFSRAQDLVWVDPDKMGGVPIRNVEGGRYSAISRAMTSYLRGHRMGQSSPDISKSDLSMDFSSLVRALLDDIPHVKESEVLIVVRNSRQRRFRVQIENRSYGPLQWKPLRIRCIQGHQKFLLDGQGMSSMIKEFFTLDPTWDVKETENPEEHPEYIPQPKKSPLWGSFPRVIYHTCDRSAFESIAEHGLIPGGFPFKTGRGHNYFNSTPPWDARMRKLQGTRAGRPIALAFDTEMLIQEPSSFVRMKQSCPRTG